MAQHNDGTLSKRFVSIDHEVEFDGDRKRPARAVLVFTDEDGNRYRVSADSPNQHVNAYYGLPMAKCSYEDLGGGAYFIHYRWDATNRDELIETEAKAMAIDQLMRFDFDGRIGWGIFEILMGGDAYPRYPNWQPMDMSSFTQDKTPVDRRPADIEA